MPNCPLKEAAREAPHCLALLDKNFSLTFAQFDRHVDQLELSLKAGDCLQIKTPTPAHFFAAWRRGASLFPLNPRLPQYPIVTQAPPQSLLLLTSGSTGTPKIAVLSLENLLANAASVIAPLDLHPQDAWRLSLPLFHVGGIGILLRCILARATLVLDDSLDITHLSYVPTHLYRATPVYRKLRCLLLGGAPLLSFPKNLPIYTTYGLTEMGSMVTLNDQILPGREVQLAPDGEILVRGPSLFQGYLGEKRPTNWFATGDLGRFEKGKLLILGRKDWMFISGGENIQPEEIERYLVTLPEVIEAVVLPLDDPEFGKRPVAVIRATKPFPLTHLQQALSPYLPKFKIPIALYFVDEIPRKNNFKIDRFILSQLIKDQTDKNRSGQKNKAAL